MDAKKNTSDDIKNAILMVRYVKEKLKKKCTVTTYGLERMIDSLNDIQKTESYQRIRRHIETSFWDLPLLDIIIENNLFKISILIKENSTTVCIEDINGKIKKEESTRDSNAWRRILRGLSTIMTHDGENKIFDIDQKKIIHKAITDCVMSS